MYLFCVYNSKQKIKYRSAVRLYISLDTWKHIFCNRLCKLTICKVLLTHHKKTFNETYKELWKFYKMFYWKARQNYKSIVHSQRGHGLSSGGGKKSSLERLSQYVLPTEVDFLHNLRIKLGHCQNKQKQKRYKWQYQVSQILTEPQLHMYVFKELTSFAQ